MAAVIDFKYTWLWGDYTAEITFTDKLLPKDCFPYIPDVRKTLSGFYVKKYVGKTTFDIIKAIQKDIKEATDRKAQTNVNAATKAIEKGQKASRKVNNSAAKEALRQDNKAILAYMLTNFCGYKKTITLTSGMKGSLRAQTITPGRENACAVLDKAYRAKPQVYPEETAIKDVIENKTVAGKEIKNNEEYDRIYQAGEQSGWGAKGGMRRTRKNRK